MRRVRYAICLVWLGLLLTGCQSAASSAPAESGIKIVATMSVLADFATQVGGDNVTVTTIVPVGGDPHTAIGDAPSQRLFPFGHNGNANRSSGCSVLNGVS